MRSVVIAVIGAPFDSTVYVFTRAGPDWSEVATLAPDSPPARFGEAVALDGNTAVVGALGSLSAGLKPVFVFTRSTSGWGEEPRLRGAESDDFYGTTLAVDGDTVLGGADGDEEPKGERGGSVFVFSRSGSTWNEEAKLFASDGDDYDGSGSSVSLDGDTAIEGALSDEVANGTGSGSAYVFSRSGSDWGERAKLAPTDGDADDAFGGTVSLDGDRALIGALADEDPNGRRGGSAYVFGI